MKQSIVSIAVLFVFCAYAYGQAPTISPVAGQSWSRTGNSAPPNNGNVIGTFFSSPFYLYTNGFLRLRVNNNLSSSVDSLPAIQRNGYVGIGNDLNGGIWSAPNPPPFSLFHPKGHG